MIYVMHVTPVSSLNGYILADFDSLWWALESDAAMFF
jgi:hypothetical protein